MSDSLLVAISFTSISFHTFLEILDKIKIIKIDKSYFKKVDELLKDYYKIIDIDENEQMINFLENNNNGKIKEMNTNIIFNYIINNFNPYIQKFCKNHVPLLQILAPLLIFNYGKIIEYYNLMINEDIKKCQDQLTDSILKEDIYKKKEKEKNEVIKTLRKKSYNLEEKVIQQSQEIIQLKQEMLNKDEEIKKINQESTEMKIKFGELENHLKYIEEKHNKEIDNHSKEISQIKSQLKIKNKELKITKKAINNIEYKYQKLEELQNVIMAEDYSNRLTIRENSQEIFENKLYIRKLKCMNNILDSKNEILEEENIKIKKLIENKPFEKDEKGKKENLEIIEMKYKIQQLTDENRELKENIKTDSEIIKGLENKFNGNSDRSQIFNYEELRERTKLYFSINHQRIRYLESKIEMKNMIISGLKKKQRKNTW